jgi:hypothetical protein
MSDFSKDECVVVTGRVGLPDKSFKVQPQKNGYQ